AAALAQLCGRGGRGAAAANAGCLAATAAPAPASPGAGDVSARNPVGYLGGAVGGRSGDSLRAPQCRLLAQAPPATAAAPGQPLCHVLADQCGQRRDPTAGR